MKQSFVKNPRLRFSMFSNNWQNKEVKDILSRISIPVDVDPQTLYQQIGIRSHGKGLFYKDKVTGSALGNKRVFWVQPDTFILNIVFAWEQAVAKTTRSEKDMIASHRFPMYKPREKMAKLDFILYFFLTKRGRYLLELASPGGAGRNKTLGQTNFEELSITIPEIDEQQKIVDFLITIDKKIDRLKKKVDLFKIYKKGIMQNIFSQEVRFKDVNDNEYLDWEEKKLSDVLEYEQPTKYIVKSTSYSKNHGIPVLTAGKTFILGYTKESDGIYTDLPVIIFDDFTTASQYVDFPFKVKSSAIKILKAKSDVNIKVAYEILKLIKFEAKDHKRYWIGEFQDFYIELPSVEEQQKISDFLKSIDKKIQFEERKLAEAKKFKKALLQQMFT